MAFIKESEHLSIPFQDIVVATKNFTTLIGKGGYGLVYKGELSLYGKLSTVAVKRLDSSISGQGFKEFLTEIKFLCRYKHPNLISLIGFCEEGNEKILVYEYAENGSLDYYLSTARTTSPLTWTQRINICIDAARGLDYLHNHAGKNHRIIHRDIKSANILLDRNWKAMISDLGLSKIGRTNENDSYLITNACGTHGYCDPVYRDTGILTKESDVYSFGVVLFEVLCGRLCFMNVNNEQRFLDRLAQRYYEEGKLNKIIDLELKNQIDSYSLNSIAEIAYQCLQNDREQRPSMDLVVKKLEEALETQGLDHEAMEVHNQNNNEIPLDRGKKKQNASGNRIVILEIKLHCESCVKKINKIVRKFNGVDCVSRNENDLDKLAVIGSFDEFKLQQYVQEKTKREIREKKRERAVLQVATSISLSYTFFLTRIYYDE